MCVGSIWFLCLPYYSSAYDSFSGNSIPYFHKNDYDFKARAAAAAVSNVFVFAAFALAFTFATGTQASRGTAL